MKHSAGHYFHVFNRGVDKRDIFANDGNYRFLLTLVLANSERQSNRKFNPATLNLTN